MPPRRLLVPEATFVPLRREVFSSRDLADILHVNESTVKRWSDSGLLCCDRTPGGHRKFTAQHLVLFLRTHSYQVPAIAAEIPRLLDQFQVSALCSAQDWTRIRQRFFREATSGHCHRCFEILRGAVAAGMPVERLCDEIISPVLGKIGELWKQGRMGVEMEHLASSATVDALARLREMLRVEPNGLRAVVSALPGDMHELPTRAVTASLHGSGWHVYHLGANTPYDSIIRTVVQHRVQLVSLSLTWCESYEIVAATLGSLERVAHMAGARLVIGGRLAMTAEAERWPAHARYGTCTELVEYASTLVPARRDGVRAR